MSGLTAVLFYIVWMLLLTLLYAGYRVVLVLAGKKRADSWTRGMPNNDPAVLTRAHHAHLNCVENFPLFAGIVFTAALIGKNAVVDQVAVYVLLARLAQSTVHLIGATHWFVFVRANLFLIQVALCFYMIWGLLH